MLRINRLARQELRQIVSNQEKPVDSQSVVQMQGANRPSRSSKAHSLQRKTSKNAC